MIDVTADEAEVLREGALPAAEALPGSARQFLRIANSPPTGTEQDGERLAA